MRRWSAKQLASGLFVMALASCQFNEKSNNESEIRHLAESYQEAFNTQDAEKLSQFWSEDAQYVNPQTGSALIGREAIKEQFSADFSEQPNAQLKLKVEKITFPSKDKAIEQGIATVIVPGEENSERAYRVIYEKKNGQWLIIKTSEEDVIPPPSHYGQLKDLEWLIGTWVDEDEDFTVESEYHWDQNKNFITQKFSMTVLDRQELDGHQIIGWDPYHNEIVSWIFDSDGGFGQGKWIKKDNSWVVDTSFTNADGVRGSSTNIFSDPSKDSFSWESTNREMDGVFLPDIEPVKIRKKG